MLKKLCIPLLLCAAITAGCASNAGSASAPQPAANAAAAPAATSASADAPKETQAAEQPAEQEAPASAGETYKYRMAMHNFGPWNDNAEMIQRWNKEYNVEFELIYVETAQAGDQINLMIASNDIPDVIQMVNLQQYYADGIIGGWSEDFFRQNAPNLTAYIDATDKSAWSISKFDGENMYSIPNFRLYDQVASPVFWRDDWLANVGISEIPKTLEETETAFYKFATEDPDGNGQNDTYGLSQTGLNPIYGAFGSMREKWIENGDGTVTYGDVKPEMKDALALLSKWYADGVLDPEFISGENEGGYWAIPHKFLNNKIGFTNIGSFYHWAPDRSGEPGGNESGEIAKEWINTGNPGTYAVGYAPEGPNGHKGTGQGDARKLRTVFSYTLVEDTDRFGRLLQIIDDMNCSTIEKSVEVNRGELGKYVEISNEFRGVNSLIFLGEAAEAPALLPFMSAIGAANTFAFIEEGGNLEYQSVAYAQRFAFYTDELTDRNFGYVSAIFAQPASNVKYNTELKKILDTGYISIILGDKPVDYFDEMVQEWYANGGETLTQEANEIYKQESK